MSNPQNAADGAAEDLSQASLDLLEGAIKGNFSPSMAVAASLMLMAFLAHLILELSKLRRGEKADYVKAIGTLAIHIILLLQYSTFASGVMTIGSALTKGGNIDGAAIVESSAKTLTARFSQHIADQRLRQNRGRVGEVLAQATTPEQQTAAKQAMQSAVSAYESASSKLDDATGGVSSNVAQAARDILNSPFLPSAPSLLLTSPTEFMNRFMESVAELVMTLAFLMTSAVILLLTMIQKTAITLILAVGPVIIVLSAFPGPTSGLLFSWGLTLLELQLWGFAVKVLGSMMGARFAAIPTTIVNDQTTVVANLAAYGENIAYCFILSGAYLLIPVLCGAMLRGGGMGSVAGQMLGQATGFASGVVSGRLGGATPGGGGGGGGDGGGGGPPSGGGGGGGGSPPSTSRAGDEGVAPAPRQMSQGEAIAKSRAIKNNMNRAE